MSEEQDLVEIEDEWMDYLQKAKRPPHEGHLLREAFNPEQPRVPAGSGDPSGEWSGGGGGVDMESKIKEWDSKLTPDQKKSIEDWGWDSRKFRNVMLNPSAHDPEDVKNAENMVATLDSAPPFEGTVYRGLWLHSEEEFDGGPFTSGSVITFKTPASSSKDQEVARGFSIDNPHAEVRVIMHMNVKHGTDISPIVRDFYKSEKEVVIRKGTSFKVLRSEEEIFQRNQGGRWVPTPIKHVFLQEVN